MNFAIMIVLFIIFNTRKSKERKQVTNKSRSEGAEWFPQLSSHCRDREGDNTDLDLIATKAVHGNINKQHGICNINRQHGILYLYIVSFVIKSIFW